MRCSRFGCNFLDYERGPLYYLRWLYLNPIRSSKKRGVVGHASIVCEMWRHPAFRNSIIPFQYSKSNHTEIS